MPPFFLKSSSATVASASSSSKPRERERPPSPLSAANASSKYARPSTSASARSLAAQARDRRGSASTTASRPSLDILPPPPPAPAIPSASTSSRSLSSRLLRRRPSEKGSLTRTPRLPSLSAASESDTPTELLTGSTTADDVFASQQLRQVPMKISDLPSPHGGTEANRDSDDGFTAPGIGTETWSMDHRWQRRIGSDGLDGWNRPDELLRTGLPPPPRQGPRRSIHVPSPLPVPAEHTPSQRVETSPFLSADGRDLWGRKVSDTRYSALMESLMPTQLPADHPFVQPPPDPSMRRPSAATSSSSGMSTGGVGRGSGSASGAPTAFTASFGAGGAATLTPAPLPVYTEELISPKRIPRPRSALSGQSERERDRPRTPPPRSSSRLDTTSYDSPFSIPASTSKAKEAGRLLDSPNLTRRKSSSPQPAWSMGLYGDLAAPLSAVPVPPIPPEALYSPPPPLRSRAPPPFGSLRRATDHSSLSSISADDEASEPISRPSTRLGAPYEVSVICSDQRESDGSMKWEITIRPDAQGVPSSGQLSLSTAGITAIAPPSASINLSLALDQPTGRLVFIQVPDSQGHVTPTRRRPSQSHSQRETPSSNSLSGRKRDISMPNHTRGNTFGAVPGKKYTQGLGLAVEVDGDGSPSSAASVERRNKLDRDAVTPPPRMETPPPLPSNPNVTTTPTSRSRTSSHTRTSSQGKTWSFSPAPSTPTNRRSSPPLGGGQRSRESTYVSSPSPRSTPRRSRIVSASSLGGGLYARGTVDGLSEELESMGMGIESRAG